MESPKMTRRDFNTSAAMTAVGLAISGGSIPRNAMGANDRIGVGVIGVGHIGLIHVRNFLRTGQVDVIAVADQPSTWLFAIALARSLPACRCLILLDLT